MTTQEILSKYQELKKLDMSIGDSFPLGCIFFGFAHKKYEGIIFTDYDYTRKRKLKEGIILIHMRYKVDGIIENRFVFTSFEYLEQFEVIEDLIKEIGPPECK